ncbi:MAG: DUF1501 domain-containing protein [Flavobacteriales bacterium]|nr:DUF1501 domain-containing protein [Flavobacteriales bacterium]
MPDRWPSALAGPWWACSMGVNMGIAINNTDDPLNCGKHLDPMSGDCSGLWLDFVRTVQRQAEYGDVIQAAAQLGCNQSTLYPVGNQPGAELAQALKIVAQLVCGGLKTKIYWVSMTGFDTHAQQVDSGDHAIGTHANLLQGLSDSIRAFQDDLYLLGLEDRVLGMTFSEFGRRIMSNASGGTDHGSSEPMFLFGTKVIPGMLGTNPVIDPNTTFNTNLAMQYDYRSVYASVLKDWFCLDQAEVDQVLLSTYQNLALIDPDDCIAASVHEANHGAGESIMEVLPNPFVERTVVRFTSTGGRILLQVFDEQGQLVRTLVNDDLPMGGHQVGCDLGQMPTGIYYCRLQNNGRQQVKNMLKVR